jgi:hypothetical protein
MKEFFARLNPTERRFVVGVAVLFFIVINLVWVWPHFSDWGKTRARMDKAHEQLVQFERGTNLIPALQKEIEKYQKQGELVPAEDQSVRFVRLIQNQAAQSGVIIVNMGSQRQSGTNAFFVEQNETVTLQSGEKQLVDFLYSLGAGNSLIRVKVLSVQPDPSHQQLATRATLVASYQRKATAARAATPAVPAKTPAARPPAATPPAAKPPAAKPPATPAAPGRQLPAAPRTLTPKKQ